MKAALLFFRVRTERFDCFEGICQFIVESSDIYITSPLHHIPLATISVYFKQTGQKYTYLPHQISMSVLRVPARVMKTLIVPTLTGLTAVLANRDSLEMVQLVMVSQNVLPIIPLDTAQN